MTRKILAIVFLALSISTSVKAGRIAYCSNNGTNGFIQVFMMNDDGSGKIQLTDLEENCMRPEWSPDGKQIVFYTDRGFIYLIRDVEKTHEQEPYYLWNGYFPIFMPGGDEVMFNNEVDDVLSILVIDTLAGAEPQMVSEGGYSSMHDITPDGSKLVYSTFINAVKTIVILDLTDSTDLEADPVSLNTEANLEPDISTDGDMITYASFDDNLKGTIRILKNGEETALTRGLPSCNVPRLSPDENYIAFAVIDDSRISLYVMDTDGNGKKGISVGGNIGTYEWIDDKRILFDAGSETQLSVGIVNIETGETDILAEGGFNLHPSYVDHLKEVQLFEK